MTLAALFSFGLVPDVAFSGSFFVAWRIARSPISSGLDLCLAVFGRIPALSPWNGSQLELRFRLKARGEARRVRVRGSRGWMCGSVDWVV